MNWFRDRFNNFRLKNLQENDALEQEIEQRAYELWEEAGREEGTFDYYYKKAQLEQEIKPTAYLLWEEAGKPKGKFQKYLQQAEIEIEIRSMTYFLWKKDGKPEDKLDYYEDYYWEKAKQKIKFKRLPIIYKPFYFVVGKPYYILERKILEPGLAWTDKQAFFDILGRLGNLAIVIGLIMFIVTEDDRRNSAIFSAWQTINSATGQSGSGGRIEALEFLNSRPLRLPFIARFPFITVTTDKHWYWDGKECKNRGSFGYRFPRQPLNGLFAPNAYLVKIKLCGATLNNSNLKYADLRGANLEYAKLESANLEYANLFQAKLQNANLFQAKLQNANLFQAKLQNADLRLANLQNANLLKTKLQNAKLESAKLQNADLILAELQNANLFEAKLQNADLRSAKLQAADLGLAELQNANLFEAKLQNADLRSAKIQAAILGGANLQDAILEGANLQDANLTDANLTDANLTDANLTDANLSGAIYTDSESKLRWCSNNDCSTTFPDNFDPKKAGMILIRTEEDYDKWKKSRQK
ncbi:pentapeptide repeat-containing protein [Crocosphaera sp.]|uniref:pentapeptide repeat-containing protein n=1 Tax=Crocosphaera sp. TaxID=2729996 RepID=UPI00260F7966|nr:pentapeptide repeat-containing protein [Crocosphaera sp.]MDJ0581233.1 pentapeptide repeat-containing protein [Crocosphaera sp.]